MIMKSNIFRKCLFEQEELVSQSFVQFYGDTEWS